MVHVNLVNSMLCSMLTNARSFFLFLNLMFLRWKTWMFDVDEAISSVDVVRFCCDIFEPDISTMYVLIQAMEACSFGRFEMRSDWVTVTVCSNKSYICSRVHVHCALCRSLWTRSRSKGVLKQVSTVWFPMNFRLVCTTSSSLTRWEAIIILLNWVRIPVAVTEQFQMNRTIIKWSECFDRKLSKMSVNHKSMLEHRTRSGIDVRCSIFRTRTLCSTYVDLLYTHTHTEMNFLLLRRDIHLIMSANVRHAQHCICSGFACKCWVHCTVYGVHWSKTNCCSSQTAMRSLPPPVLCCSCINCKRDS